MVTDIPVDQLKIWTDGNMEAKRYEYFFYVDDLVIDLGAYQGEFAQKIYEMYGIRVLAVEPTTEILRLNGHSHITVIPKAAWIEAGTREFGGNAYWTSSTLEPTQKYSCFDILDILASPVALLKINIEGDEYEVLNRILQSGVQNHITNFQIQFHQVTGYNILYHHLAEELSKTHEKTWGVDWVWENWKLKSND